MDPFGIHTCIKFYDVDDEYKKVLNQLAKDFNEASTLSERLILFDNFANEFTVIPDIWELFINSLPEDTKDISYYVKSALLHFYSYSCFKTARSHTEGYSNPLITIIPFLKCYDYAEDSGNPADLLTFPHADLEYLYSEKNEFSEQPISEATLMQYKVAKSYTNRLSNENLSYEQWIEVLFEWKDEKFAIQTIENKLSRCFEDKLLWKAYIKAMKYRNIKIMFSIYHRYTRLFLLDNEMKNKYEKEIKAFEKNEEFDNLPELEWYLFDNVKIKHSCKEFYSAFNNYYRQNYLLPNTIIEYILNNSRVKLRLNLFKVCKSLFLQKSTPICHQLNIRSTLVTSKYSLQSLQLTGTQNDLETLRNLHITNRWYIEYPDIHMTHSIIPKLYKCEARFICIIQQVITFEDYEFLVDPYKIEKFEFSNGGITKHDGSGAALDNILHRLSNAYDISIVFNEKYQLSAIFSLSSLERTVKIQNFKLMYLNSLFNIIDYCNFILKNAAPSASFKLGYSNNVSLEEVISFDHAVNVFTMENFNKEFQKKSQRGYPVSHEMKSLTKFVKRQIVDC